MGSGDSVLAYGDVAATDPADQIVQDRVTEGQVIALDTQALSFGPKQAVDAVFGTGWYDAWQELRQRTPPLRQRTAANQERYSKIESFGARSELGWDLRKLESLAKDYDDRMTRAANGEPINVEETREYFTMYSLATEVLTTHNDALHEAFLAGVVAGFHALPFAVLRIRALRLQELLGVLKTQLELAKKEVNEAWQQSVLDAALFAVTWFLPVGLITRGAILIGQGLFDNAMGPSTSTQATVGAHASKAGEFYSAVKEVTAATGRTQTIAKAGGTGANVVGFYFDYKEILVGYKNVDRLGNAIHEATSALTKLNNEISQYLPVVEKFVQQYEVWQAAIANTRTQADLTRRALEDDMRRNKYNVH